MTEKPAYCVVCDICGAHSFSTTLDSAKENCCESVGRIKHQYSVGDVVIIHRLVSTGPGTWGNEYMDIEVEITEACWALINHQPHYFGKQLTGPQMGESCLINSDSEIKNQVQVR